MRLFFVPIAPLMLVLLVGCSWVDPSECWVNTSGGIGDNGTIPIGAGVGASASGDFAFPPPGGPLDYGGAPNPCVTPQSPGGADKPQSPGGADAFTGIDPQLLGKESLKSEALGYDVYGLLNSLNLDPETVDRTTVDGLVEQYAPMAKATVDNWLATTDPSTIQTSDTNPKWECTEQHKCPYRSKCSNAPYSAISPHNCWVVNCGSAKCSGCPDWFPDWLTAPLYKSWCAYVCTDQSYPMKVVATGAAVVDHWGSPHPEAGPYCFAP